ncbi:MAG: hypothetical protein ABL934_06670 [Lysobacteraceae bacterium]
MKKSVRSVLLFGAVLLAGCVSGGQVRTVVVERPVPASIQHYPEDNLPAGAPPSSLVRCESLPPLAVTPETATIKQLLIEIQKARHSYVVCAKKHNVLIDFESKIEKSVIEIYNFYKRQSIK